MSKPVTITGPAGRIEGLLARAQRTTRRAIVLCHPHPQFGGTMHDSVLDLVSKALLNEGVDCLRFNFRGVGNSTGLFDNGVGETDDTLAVMAFARDSLNTDEIWLGGYSFGAGVAWRAAQETDDLDRLMLFAPPNARMPFEGDAPNIPVHIFAGADDDLIDWPALEAWVEAHHRRLTLTRLEGTDHGFGGATDRLGPAIRAQLKD